jgi:porin
VNAACCIAVAASLLASGAPELFAQAPLPDYKGSPGDRPFLSGDWNGSRSDLAAKGLTFEVDWTQTAQGVAAGGRSTDWDYGGSLNYIMDLDLSRLGLWKGAFVRVRGESRYGETVNDDSGAFLPVNTNGFFPLTSPTDDGLPFAITELAFAQFLSEKFAVFLGKLQTLDGDPNEFASGRGRTQFMNANFIFNGTTANASPYSALGGGFVWIPNDWITINNALIGLVDASTTTGFNTINQGLAWTPEADFQYRLGGLPGGANIGGIYAFAGDFTKLGGRLTLLPTGVALESKSTSWAVYGSAWQYLYTSDTVPGKIDLANMRADLRGFGLFARLGFADPTTNPIEWSASIGLGGRALLPRRENDTWGVGYYYSRLRNLRQVLNVDNASAGVEAYYNVALTPAAGLTFDFQWVDGATNGTNPATLLGARLDIRF